VIMESHLDYSGKKIVSAIDAHAPLTNSFPPLPSIAANFSLSARSGASRAV